jgi:hypothetical protein
VGGDIDDAAAREYHDNALFTEDEVDDVDPTEDDVDPTEDDEEASPAEDEDVPCFLNPDPILPPLNARELDTCFFDMWEKRLNVNDENDDGAQLGELLIMYFDWMTSHKVTLTCARGVHALLTLMVPKATTSMPQKYATINSMLTAVYNHNVQVVHLCPNDCIAYWDATHPKLLVEDDSIPALASGYKHAHRNFCPKCLAERYITVNGVQVPAKKGYFFDPDNYLTGIFRDVDAAKTPYRSRGFGMHQPGHTAHSHGYYRKMEQDENMRGELRNIALIAMADGTRFI